MRILWITGLPGSGKSTLAPHLGRTLGLPALDSDRIIEERAGFQTGKILEIHGERGFREREQEVLREITLRHRSGAVAALGGGAMGQPGNPGLIKTAGFVLCLTGRSQGGIIRRSIQEQMALYRIHRDHADWILDTSGPKDIRSQAAEAAAQFRKWLTHSPKDQTRRRSR